SAAILCHAALFASMAACGSGNTGSLDLFAPSAGASPAVPSTPTSPTTSSTADARPPAPSAQADARPPPTTTAPPPPGCPDGGCVIPPNCSIDDDCHSGSASRCEAASRTCVECLSVTDC